MPNKDGKGLAGRGGQGRRNGNRKGAHRQQGGQARGYGRPEAGKQRPGKGINKGIIAVSAEGNSKNSLFDLRFGRCNFFMLFNPESRDISFLPNPGKEASGGAGPIAAELLANHGVTKVFSGDFGPKAADALKAMDIEMVVLQTKGESLESLIHKLNN
ncbi:MAG: hypothetical protein K9H84_02665 [Bacteroidales bacterium]|nr:hypothetical protein [Bacteroidales bacterium]